MLGPVERLGARPALDDHRRRGDPDYDRWWRDSPEATYRDALMRLEPEKPGAFFYPWLHVLLQK